MQKTPHRSLCRTRVVARTARLRTNFRRTTELVNELSRRYIMIFETLLDEKFRFVGDLGVSEKVLAAVADV